MKQRLTVMYPRLVPVIISRGFDVAIEPRCHCSVYNWAVMHVSVCRSATCHLNCW